MLGPLADMPLIFPNGRPAPTISVGSGELRGGNLIVRVLRGRVTADHVRPFRERAQRALLDARINGCVYSQVGRQAHKDGSEQIVIISVWTGMAALYDWLGTTDLLDSPIVAEGGQFVLEDLDVQHYEVVDVTGAENPFGVVASALSEP